MEGSVPAVRPTSMKRRTTTRKRNLRFALVVMTVIAGGCTASHKTGAAASTTTTPSTAAASSSSTTSTTTKPNESACVNGIVTDSIRAALLQANGMPGGQVVAGATYYGTCGSASYAATRFQPAPHATLQEQVSFQDDGSGPRFFVQKSGTAWALVGTSPYDQARSCARFTQLPSGLRTLWLDCPLG
jgi:hypothetical protein